MSRGLMRPHVWWAVLLVVLALLALASPSMRAWWHSPVLFGVLALQELARLAEARAAKLRAELEALMADREVRP